MSKPKEPIKTHLTKDLRYFEFMHNGVKCENQTPEDNEENDFYFEECEQVFIEGFGNCYKFFDWYYVCEGYQWYRFMMADLILISN